MANIKKLTAIIAMLVLGTLGLIYGFRNILFDITDSTFGIVGIALGVILLFEIGLKRISTIGRIKKLETQQWIGFIIAFLVIITGIGLLFNIQIPVISQIANGSFLTGGAFVILEAVTF